MTYVIKKATDTVDKAPEVDLCKSDTFIRQCELMMSLNPKIADHIIARALEAKKTPAKILSELVWESNLATAAEEQPQLASTAENSALL